MTEEYEIVKRVLGNLRSLRVFARECDFEWLEEANNKLSAVIDERRSEHEQEKKQIEELERKRQQAISMLAEMGLTPDDLISGVQLSSGKPKKSSREQKYVYTDEKGEQKKWAGVGRKPKPIQAALDEGRTLDEFLINKEERPEENKS